MNGKWVPPPKTATQKNNGNTGNTGGTSVGPQGPQGPAGEGVDEQSILLTLFAQVKKELKKPEYRGPQGPAGPIGPAGPRGLPGVASPSADLGDILARLTALENGEIEVVFQGGDESSEPDVTVMVPLREGRLVIPPQFLTVRILDVNGSQVGETQVDEAGLGQPLKIRFRERGRVSVPGN